jgi:hypothetical protein
MRHWTSFALAALAALGAAAPARAQVVVQTPWVTVEAPTGPGGRVRVQTPWFSFGLDRCGPAAGPRAGAAPAGVDWKVAPGLPPAPGEPPPVPVPAAVDEAPAAAAPSLAEFAASFRPRPGRHEVTLRHPVTGAAVPVSFTLPDAPVRRVRVHRRSLDFDYGRHNVSLRFLANGQVRVRE